MLLVKPSVELLWVTPNPLEAIEIAGRTCYKSEDKITAGSAEKFVKMLLDRGHEAMIEHASMSMRFICDRGVSHEIVRHRLFSFAQESTRYCNYKGGVEFIIPCWIYPLFSGSKGDAVSVTDAVKDLSDLWVAQMHGAEKAYLRMIEGGWKPQQARSVLPNSLKTEIVVTGNMRQWRHFFRLRCDKAAHPQMREVAEKALNLAIMAVPVLFDNFEIE